eukprot:CAMPEP_0168692214 /NCGR_PEP_ID=MMETSP0503-20121227/33109_1 /TAXON_ID=89963 /ORGANISM="Heterocapsa rotundata, Strain SCCAP K-0483" /LENGTH=75 /DNA_ID=CAMNT_0008737713 /DNA_START=21 /DNA_END=245 /DNA_ORIENTATION=+
MATKELSCLEASAAQCARCQYPYPSVQNAQEAGLSATIAAAVRSCESVPVTFPGKLRVAGLRSEQIQAQALAKRV